MKVLFLSNWNDTCGISEYGTNIFLELNKSSEITISPMDIGQPLEEIVGNSADADIVHLNWQPGVSRVFNPAALVAAVEKPIIYTNHYTHLIEPWHKNLAAMVVHTPIDTKAKVFYIPMGIIDLDLPDTKLDKLVVGSAGFPFAHKRHDITCLAVNALHRRGIEISVLFFMPETYRTDPHPIISQCKQLLGDVPSEFVTDWLDEHIVIRRLNSETSVGVYPGESSAIGASGSVRMSLAALRPTVVNSSSNLVKDLLDISGIYSFENIMELADIILEAHNSESPRKFVKANSYFEAAKKYAQVYKEIA